MRQADDQRLWLDRYQLHQTYGLFPDQKFYSKLVVATDDELDAMRGFVNQVEEYHEWCRAAFHAIHEGAQMPEPPGFMLGRHPLEDVVIGLEQKVVHTTKIAAEYSRTITQLQEQIAQLQGELNAAKEAAEAEADDDAPEGS